MLNSWPRRKCSFMGETENCDGYNSDVERRVQNKCLKDHSSFVFMGSPATFASDSKRILANFLTSVLSLENYKVFL